MNGILDKSINDELLSIFMVQRFSYIRILVDNFTAMFDFYKNILQLPLKYGGIEDVYCEFETGNTDIALYDRKTMKEETGLELTPTNTIQANIVIIIQVESLNAMKIHLSEAGVDILTPPTKRPEWEVTTMHIKDPEGNLLEINETLSEQ